MVLEGEATDGLLDSYESERRHVAIVNSIQSVKNGKQIFRLLKTLGIGDDVAQARKNLYASLQDPEKKKLIDEGVEGQREHFDNVSPNYQISDQVKIVIVPSWSCTLAMFTALRKYHHMRRYMNPNSKLGHVCLIPGLPCGRHAFGQWTFHMSRNSPLKMSNAGRTALSTFVIPGNLASLVTLRFLAFRLCVWGKISALLGQRAIGGFVTQGCSAVEESSSGQISTY